MSQPPGIDHDSTADGQREERSYVEVSVFDDRIEQLETKMMNALQNSVASSSESLLKTCIARFAAREVDLSTSKGIAKHVEPDVRQKVDERISAIEVGLVSSKQLLECIDKTSNERCSAMENDINSMREIMKSSEPVNGQESEKRIESDIIAMRQQIQYLEVLLGDFSGLGSNPEWQVGDHIFLEGMKSMERENKCGVIYSVPTPQCDRVAILLDDEDAPIRVPRSTIRLLPLKSMLHNLESKLDYLGKVVWDEMKLRTK